MLDDLEDKNARIDQIKAVGGRLYEIIERYIAPYFY